MPHKRIIPKILLKNYETKLYSVITKSYQKTKIVATPKSHARILQAQSANEISLINISEFGPSSEIILATLNEIASELLMPITVAGNIRTIEEIEVLFRNGADKIQLCTMMFTDQESVRHAISIFGASNITACLDVGLNGNCFIQGGQIDTEHSLEDAIKVVTSLGFGEISVNCIVRDGSRKGIDRLTIEKLKGIKIPAIVGCGIGCAADIQNALKNDWIDGVCVGTFLSRTDQNIGQLTAQVVNTGTEI